MLLFERDDASFLGFSERPRHCCPVAHVKFVANRLGRPMPPLTLLGGMQPAPAGVAPFTNAFPASPPSDVPMSGRMLGVTSYRKQPTRHVTSVSRQTAADGADVVRRYASLPDAVPHLASMPLVSVPTTSTGGAFLTQPTRVVPHFHASTSYWKQPTVTSVPRQPGSLSSLSRTVSSSNVVAPFDSIPRQIWHVRPPCSPLSALRSAVQSLPPTSVPSSPYSNLRPDARFSVPCMSESDVMPASTVRSVGFQCTPQLPGPRGDFGQQKQLMNPQQQQQQQQQVYGTSSQKQLISLLMHHHLQLTSHFITQADSLLNTVVSELCRVAAPLNALSPTLRNAFDLVKLLNNKQDAVRWQYRVEYMRAYNLFDANNLGRTGLARANPNFIRENLRVVVTYSQRLEVVTVELNRCLLSLTNCATRDATVTAEAAILGHIVEFWRLVDVFREALTAFTMKTGCRRPQAHAAGQVADCSQSQSVPDTGAGRTSSLMSEAGQSRQQANDDDERARCVQQAFNDDVDQLLLQQHQQQQPVTVIALTCHHSTSDVGGLSDNTTSLDSRVSRCSLTPDPVNMNVEQQIDPPQTSSTNMDMGDSQSTEVKFSHVLQSRQVQQTDLGYITIDDDHDSDAEPQPSRDLDTRLVDPCGTHLSDGLDNKAQVARAVDLMSIGGFHLFVPFSPTCRQPDESGTRSVGSTGVASDSGDSGIVVKQEHTDVMEDLLSPVTSTADQKVQDADAAVSASVWPRADDVAEDGEETNLICRIESVFSIPPGGFEAAEISVFPPPPPYSSSSKLPRPTFGEKQTDEKMPVTDEQESSEYRDRVPALLSSSTKIAAVGIQSRLLRRCGLPKLTTSEINGVVRKRKTSKECTMDDNRRKKARNVNYQRNLSDKPLSPTKASSQSTWVFQKKLIIPSPAIVKRRRGRPPKRRIDTLVMPSPAELKRRPAAWRKILASYRSAQFTPLDGSKRVNVSVVSTEPPRGCRPVGQGEGRSGQSSYGAKSSKTTAKFNVGSSKSQVAAGNGGSAPRTLINTKLNARKLNARSKKSSSSLRNGAKPLLPGADNSTKQSVVKSCAAAESTATMLRHASCPTSLAGDDQSKKMDPATEDMSSDDNVTFAQRHLHHTVSQHFDENSSSLSHADVQLVAETTIATASHGGFHVTDIENDDEEDPDRLVIDLDHTDRCSNYSMLSDNCNDRDRIQTTSANNECNEKSSTSTNVSCLPEADKVAAATYKMSRPDCRFISGDDVTCRSTSSGLLPVHTSTLDKINCVWSNPIYSDISSEDEDNDDRITSTAGSLS